MDKSLAATLSPTAQIRASYAHSKVSARLHTISLGRMLKIIHLGLSKPAITLQRLSREGSNKKTTGAIVGLPSSGSCSLRLAGGHNRSWFHRDSFRTGSTIHTFPSTDVVLRNNTGKRTLPQ